jgi:hypothetical protein
MSVHTAKLNISYRLAEVDNGDSVFLVLINGKAFEFKSSNGGIEFYQNKTRTILKIRVWTGRGTYIGGEHDYYYHLGDKGQIALLGNLKESWYEGENLIRVDMGRFTPVVVPVNSSIILPLEERQK